MIAWLFAALALGFLGGYLAGRSHGDEKLDAAHAKRLATVQTVEDMLAQRMQRELRSSEAEEGLRALCTFAQSLSADQRVRLADLCTEKQLDLLIAAFGPLKFGPLRIVSTADPEERA